MNNVRSQQRRRGRVLTLGAAGVATLLVLSACSDRKRTLPIANVPTPASPAREQITIRYTLRDRSSSQVRIMVDYRIGPNGPWIQVTEGPGSEGTVGLQATPGGVNHIFVWDSVADLGARYVAGVQVRVVPRRKGNRGTVGRTALFIVDNAGIFVSAGSLPGAFRDRHTVTALAGGKILVAGGVDAIGNPLASAEVYDPWNVNPVTGRYDPIHITMAATMVTARERHVAVALGDGRVLLLGGVGGGGHLDTAEVFHFPPAPMSPTFTSVTGVLGDPKVDFTATLLADGQVIIAGGHDGAVPVASADIFTPSAPGLGGTLNTTIPLTRPRQGHFAIRLADARVLFGGGADDGMIPTPGPIVGEVFDPAMGTIADTAMAMTEVRHYGAAGLLGDGTVAIHGGEDGLGMTLQTGEIYDPALDLFAPIAISPPPPSPRAFAAGHSVPGGNVIFIGGSDGAQGLTTADLFTLFPVSVCATASEFCASPGQMASPRPRPATGQMPDGRVYVGGGGGAPEIYVPPGPTGGEDFRAVALMTRPRAEHTMTTLPGGSVLAAGGNDGLMTTDTVEIYDPTTDAWAPGPMPMTTPREGHTATLLTDGTVLLAGGDNSGPLVDLEIYDAQTMAFITVLPSLADARSDHTATLLIDGTVLIAGGEGPGAAVGTWELYQPGPPPPAWPSGGLVTARRGHRAVRLQSGGVLLVGGENSLLVPPVLDSAEIYDFTAGAFAPVTDTVGRRRLHAVELLPDGRVVVIGGEDDTGVILQDSMVFDPILNPTDPPAALGPSMVNPRSDFTSAALATGTILVAAGFNGTRAFHRAEVFDLRFDFVFDSAAPLPSLLSASMFGETEGGNLGTRRKGAPSALLPDGRLLISGGRDNNDVPLDRTELFSP